MAVCLVEVRGEDARLTRLRGLIGTCEATEVKRFLGYFALVLLSETDMLLSCVCQCGNRQRAKDKQSTNK